MQVQVLSEELEREVERLGIAVSTSCVSDAWQELETAAASRRQDSAMEGLAVRRAGGAGVHSRSGRQGLVGGGRRPHPLTEPVADGRVARTARPSGGSSPPTTTTP